MAQSEVRCRGSGDGQRARGMEEPSREGSSGGGELLEVAGSCGGGVAGGSPVWLFAFALLAFAHLGGRRAFGLLIDLRGLVLVIVMICSVVWHAAVLSLV